MKGLIIDTMTIEFLNKIFYVTIAVVLLGIIAAIWLSRKNHKEIARINEYIANITIPNNMDIPGLFENMVQETFQEYIIIHGEYANIDYINEEIEAKMMKELGKMVSSRISPAMLDKISLHYNLQHIGEIISDKIYIIITAYVIEKNKPNDKA